MQNKELIEHIFAELAQANSRPMVELLADDVQWHVMGTTPWSRTYVGKQSVLTDLLGVLRTRLADRYRATAQRILADGDHVVVQARGQSTTKSGVPYNNEYCFIYRMENGRIVEVTEYLDTQLLMTALGGSD
jgi:ketosteroid isomerase-like protein